MSLQFARAKPLQACKLAAIVVVVPVGAAVFFGVVPYRGLLGLFIVPLLALGLVVTVTAETLLAGYRQVRTDRSLIDRLAEGPLYSTVRTVEALAAVLAVGAFAFVLGTLPDGPMAGPGAIWIWFVVVGLGLLVLAGSLVRTLVEYVVHRRTAA